MRKEFSCETELVGISQDSMQSLRYALNIKAIVCLTNEAKLFASRDHHPQQHQAPSSAQMQQPPPHAAPTLSAGNGGSRGHHPGHHPRSSSSREPSRSNSFSSRGGQGQQGCPEAVRLLDSNGRPNPDLVPSAGSRSGSLGCGHGVPASATPQQQHRIAFTVSSGAPPPPQQMEQLAHSV